MQSTAVMTKSAQDFSELYGVKSPVRNDETKHDLFSVFIVYGLPIEEKLEQHRVQIEGILDKMGDPGDHSACTAQLKKLLNGPCNPEVKPRILGFVDQHTYSDYQKQDLKYLRQKYPFSAALQGVSTRLFFVISYFCFLFCRLPNHQACQLKKQTWARSR